jgi:hypothetical protein
MNLQTMAGNEPSLEEKATIALRRNVTNDSNEVFKRTMEVVGEELETASAKYLITFLGALATDIGYTFMDVLSSSLVKEKMGDLSEGDSPKSKVDLGFLGGMLPSLERLIEKNDSGESQETLNYIKEHRDALVIYCTETGEDPASVLNSVGGSALVAEIAYDTLDKYEERFVSKSEEIQEVLQEATGLVSMFPIGILAAAGIDSLAGEAGVDLENISLDPSVAGNFVGSFVNDLTTFTNAYLAESIRYNKREIAVYKAIL